MANRFFVCWFPFKPTKREVYPQQDTQNVSFSGIGPPTMDSVFLLVSLYSRTKEVPSAKTHQKQIEGRSSALKVRVHSICIHRSLDTLAVAPRCMGGGGGGSRDYHRGLKGNPTPFWEVSLVYPFRSVLHRLQQKYKLAYQTHSLVQAKTKLLLCCFLSRRNVHLEKVGFLGCTFRSECCSSLCSE